MSQIMAQCGFGSISVVLSMTVCCRIGDRCRCLTMVSAVSRHSAEHSWETLAKQLPRTKKKPMC